MIVKVVIPDALYNRVYFARGEQGPQGATGPQGVQGAQGPTGLTGPAGADGTSYTPGDPIYVTVRNSTGSPLLKGSIVYVSGSNGNHVQVSLAQAIGDITSARTIGWVADTIPNNTEGLIMVEGYLTGLNTQGITAGAQLYLSPTVPGGFTQTKPVAPDHMVYVGVAVKISAGDGHVYVKVQNGYELDELHDVKITSPVNNQVLTYDSATDLWVNATNPADGVTSITASSPLTGGTITSTGSIGLDQSLLTLAQSQVTGLVTALAGKAGLADTQTFTGTNTFNAGSTFNNFLTINSVGGNGAGSIFTTGEAGGLNKILIAGSRGSGGVVIGTSAAVMDTPVLAVRAAATQTGALTEWRNNAQVVLTSITSAGNFNTGQVRSGTTAGLGQLSVVSAGATTIGAVVRGAASQTANLQEWQNSAGTVLGSMSASGQFAISNFLNINASNTGIAQFGVYRIRFDGNNTGIGSQTPSVGGGVGVIAIQNAGTVPTSNPTAGGILYVESGALKFRGSSGTVTTIANA